MYLITHTHTHTLSLSLSLSLSLFLFFLTGHMLTIFIHSISIQYVISHSIPNVPLY